MFDPSEIRPLYPQCEPCHYKANLYARRGYGIILQPCASCPRNPHKCASGSPSGIIKPELSGAVVVKRLRKLRIPIDRVLK